MPLRLDHTFSEDDISWAKRSEFWKEYSSKSSRPGRKKRFQFREPLVLCGHAIRIRVDHETLLIRTGLTHYPQKPEEIRLFPGDAKLPNRIVVLDGSGGITFDALNWMSEQRIEFVRLNWDGRISNIGNGSGYSANSKLTEFQREIRGTMQQIKVANRLISAKFENSISTLQNSIPGSEKREKAISTLQKGISDIRKSRYSTPLSRLFGIEGMCAGAYFGSWQGLPLNWADLRKRPIPTDWSEFGTRTMGWRKRSRVARHPINAMLNYGYGILANHVRSEIISNGFDPTIGILHGNSENPNPLVYDLMEPLRPKIDRVVLEFATSRNFQPNDFTINKWGACRLNPHFSKALVSSVEREHFQIQSAAYLKFA